MDCPSPLPLLAAALFCAPLYTQAAPDWPQFRGPDANGITTAKNLPLEWSATKGVAWSVEIPGKGWSSPVLSEGKLYLTAAVGDASAEVGLNVLCLDQSTGAVLWNKEVFRPDPGDAKAMHKKNTAASPTPIVAGGKVYAHFGHMGTAALDLQGNVLWRQTSLKYKPVHGTGGSPVLVGDSLIFGADGLSDPFIAALNVQNGEVRWQKPRNTGAKKQFSFSTPAVIQVGGVPQVISPYSGFVAAYNPADGTEYWKVAYGEGYSVVPRPVFAHGLLYLSSGFDSAALYAIRPEGAAGDATATAVAWTLKKGAPHTPSVLVVGNNLFCVSDGGIASCVNALTGEVHWSERLTGNFSASPIAAGDRLYFLNETGVTSVVKAAQTFELLATNDLGEKTLASPAPADGALFIRGENHLFKLVP
jgi:outer membrane protein assembly factor BamB